MIGLRRLNNGKWNKDPVLTAARAVVAQGLGRQYQLSPLGKMATFVNGTSYDVGLIGTGDTPVIRISNITDPLSEYIRTGQRFDSKFHVGVGDLLVSWSASFKSILWPGPPGILNQHIFNVVEEPGNDRNYVRHAIEAAFEEIQRNVVGIGMMHLRRGDFLGHAVPCPQHVVQAAVGRYLDWVETACQGPEPALPGNFEREREAVDRIRSVATKLGEVQGLREQVEQEVAALSKSLSAGFFNRQSGWPLVPLESVCLEIVDNLHSNPAYSNDGVPCVRSSDVGWGTLNLETARRTTEDEYKHRTVRGEPMPGDVVFVREGGGTGKAALVRVGQRFSLVQRVMMLRPNSDVVLPEFFLHQVLSPAVQDEQITPNTIGSASPHLNIGALRQFEFLLPPKGVQEHVVERLSSIGRDIDAVTKLQRQTAELEGQLIPLALDAALS